VKEGLWALKRTIRQLGGRVIDRRTTVGKQLARWRAELTSDLGGDEAISTAEKQIVDLAVRTKLMLDSIDAWILTQPTLIVRRTRSLLPVVKERVALTESLARYLTTLGLKRRARELPSLGEYLAAKSTPEEIAKEETKP
jgi:hypothetical protein